MDIKQQTNVIGAYAIIAPIAYYYQAAILTKWTKWHLGKLRLNSRTDDSSVVISFQRFWSNDHTILGGSGFPPLCFNLFCLTLCFSADGCASLGHVSETGTTPTPFSHRPVACSDSCGVSNTDFNVIPHVTDTLSWLIAASYQFLRIKPPYLQSERQFGTMIASK